MEPQQKKSMVMPIAIAVLISAVIFGIGGYYLASGQLGTETDTSSGVITTPKATATTGTSAAQEAAIQAAKQYRPPAGTMCTQALVPALHVESGAKYIFSSGCLAPGWKAEE